MPEERRQQILHLLRQKKRVSVASLARKLHVSERTVRRDLAELEASRLVDRVRGGAALPERGQDVSIFTRSRVEREAKAAIARCALQLIEPDQRLILDAGTTTFELARQLPRDFRLTIVSNAINVVSVLVEHDQVEVVVTGGILRQPTLSLVGPQAVASLSGVTADMAVLGCTAMDGRGLYNSNLLEAEVKQAMIRASRRVVVVADATKLGRQDFALFANWQDIDIFVTDRRIPLAAVEAIRSHGVEVRVPEDF